MVDVVDEISTHLEFLGYEIVRNDTGSVSARHQSHFNVVFKQYGYGLLFSAYFGTNPDGIIRRDEMLARCNAFHREARVCRGYLDNDSDLIVEAVFPAFYNKAAFAVFLEALNADLRNMAKDTVNLAEFLD